MKKTALSVTALCLLLTVLVGCGRRNQGELHFNTTNTMRYISTVFFSATDVSIELTNGQLNAVFPGIDLPLTANALYRSDGTLIEVTAIEYEQHIRIRLSPSELVLTEMLVHEDPPQISYINGVAVTALMTGGDGFNASFQADFTVGNINYHIAFFWERHSGQLIMNELVNQIIFSRSANLSVLSDPVLLENFQHELTISEAYLDPNFGAFVPRNIAESLTVTSVTRHRENNRYALRLEMETDHGQLSELTWHITNPTGHDLARIVTVGGWQAPDLQFPSPRAANFFNNVVIEWTGQIKSFPVFLVEELTPGVFWACVYRLRGNVEMSIITDDTIISIFSYRIPPEYVWDMISEILKQAT